MFDTAPQVTGTLDGVTNSQKVTVLKNGNPPLECGLIPSVKQLNLHGYWRGYVNGEEMYVVHVNHTGGRALVQPPLNMTTFGVEGEAEITCRFYTDDGYLLFDFNRSVEVIGEFVV